VEKCDRNTKKSRNFVIESDVYSDIKYGIKLGYRNIGLNGKVLEQSIETKILK